MGSRPGGPGRSADSALSRPSWLRAVSHRYQVVAVLRRWTLPVRGAFAQLYSPQRPKLSSSRP